jgi:hypothetical protein
VTVDFAPTPTSIDRAIRVADATGSIGVAILLRSVRDRRIALFLCPPEVLLQ